MTTSECRYPRIVLRNCTLYVFDGITKMRKGNIGGIKEMKYPIRNNHVSADECIEPDRKEMAKRDIARRTKMIGAINKYLCCCNYSHNVPR